MPVGPPNATDVTNLALAARDGDRDALDQFIRATQRDVWRCVAHLAEPALADDLTQETYLRALRSLHSFSARSSAKTWLLSIARRVVVDQIRRATVRPRSANVDDWQAAIERAQPTAAPGFDDGIAMSDVVRQLTDERREAFVLTQLNLLTYSDVAEICGCPVGTVRSRVARARADLIQLMDDTGNARLDVGMRAR